MKAALIFTPNQLSINTSELAFRDDSIGFIPPLSLMAVASIMEQEGVEVQIIDMAAEQLDYAQTLEQLNRFSPDILGFTITTLSFHAVLAWIQKFKDDTSLPVLVGGEHVRLYPSETMSHRCIDFCIVGEAELPLPLFIKAFRNGSSFHGIKSLGFRTTGDVVIDRTLQTIDNIDSAPFPARHLIKNHLYENVISKRKNFTAMISSRGCPFNCSFCNANHQKYRRRSAGNFVDEIQANLVSHAIRDFDIYDSTFTADRQRVLDICSEIRTRNLDVSFSVRSRVDVISKDMIDALHAAGCHTIMYGIESSSPEILQRMNKGISTKLVRETVSYTKQRGIDTLGFFMFGYPGETRTSIEETIRFSLQLPLDYAQYTVLWPLPDTEVYDYYRRNGMSDYWAEYTLDEKNERLLELVDTDVTRDEAVADVASAYRRFYFRPRIILKRCMKLRSLREFRKLATGAFGILARSLRSS